MSCSTVYIAFIVYDAKTGSPIKGATVSCGAAGMQSTGANGSTGEFTFRRATTYPVVISHANYETLISDYNFGGMTIGGQCHGTRTHYLSPPIMMEPKDVIEKRAEVFGCGGKSELLNELCSKSGVSHNLTVDYSRVIRITGPLDEKPADRTLLAVLKSWQEGEEHQRRQHKATGKWYWVVFPCTLADFDRMVGAGWMSFGMPIDARLKAEEMTNVSLRIGDTRRLYVAPTAQYRDAPVKDIEGMSFKVKATQRGHVLMDKETAPGEITGAERGIGAFKVWRLDPYSDTDMVKFELWYKEEAVVPTKDLIVQYEAEGDRISAGTLGGYLNAPVIRADADEAMDQIRDYKRVVVVGAQLANSLFKKITDETGMRAIDQEDEMYAFIQVGKWKAHDVWLVAGWTRTETSEAVKYIRDYGLPAATVRKKIEPLTGLQAAWKDYFDDPDIVKALGLLPSAIQNSFSKVFSRYNIITGRGEEAGAQDYIAVGLIIGGVALASTPVVYGAISAIPGVGAAGMMKGSLGALEAAIESTAIKPTLTAKIMGWLTSPAALKTIVASAIGLIGTDTFMDFIGEEAVQTAGMGVWTLISAKDWQGAKIALDKYRVFISHLKAKVDLVGYLNPIAYGAFKNYYEAAEAQAASYEQTINANLGILPEEFPEIIRATVRDIIDGDTIDVGLDAYNKVTGEPYKLPEYGATGHARIRMVGINAPEKSPKGEIACSDVEIYEVEKKWADTARDRLMPLNDKEVVLKVDPKNQIDTHGRILALVEFGWENINLRQIKEGLACGYYREENKYVDRDLYARETLAAKEAGIGMWEQAKVAEKFGVDFSINVDSVPSNAKLYIDDTYTHHLTPSNETELADVMDLLVPGEHVFKATKAGKEGSVKATIVKGANPAIMITLKTVGLKVEVPEEIPPEVPEVPPEVITPVITPPVEEFSIYIDSNPTNAKLWIDGVYTHHYTHSDERELKDVMDLLTPGKHIIKATKGGKEAEQEVEILPGKNEPIMLTLGVVGLPAKKEDIEKQIKELEAKIAELKKLL